MISRNGIELSCPVPGHVGNSVFDNCRDFPDILAMAERMARGEQGVATYRFNRIRENIVSKTMKQAAFMPIRLGNNFWSIVIATPEDEVMGALLGFRNRLLLIAVFLVIGMGLFFYVLFRTRILVEEIERRRKTEGALRESEQRLSDIIDFLPDATFAIDKQGNVITWNRAMEEMSGVRARDMLGKGDYEYALPFYGIRRPLLIDLVFISDEEIEKAYHFVRKKGDILLAEADVPVQGKTRALWGIARPLYDSKGNITGAIESIRDITKRKQAEEALKNSEKLYRSVIENIQDTFYRTDIDGNLTMMSPSGAALFGYDSVDEMIGLSATEAFYIVPGERQRLLSTIEVQGFVKDYELKLKRRDGTPVEISTSSHPYFDESGAFLGIEGILRDMSERKRAEKALRNSEERFSRAFHISPAPTIISTLEDGLYVDVNDGFLCMLGYAREEMIGRTASELNVWANYDDRKRVAQKLIEQGSLRGELLHLQTKSGEIRDVLVSTEGITLNEQNFILSIFYDITDQRNLENQLRQIHKMEAIGTLAGGIAHDFNNILSAVIGYTEMALGEPKIDDRLRRYLGQIYKAGERARDLVKQILAFSRQQEQQRKPLLVAPVIKEGIKLLRSSLPSTIQITMSITTAPTMILADPTQIHQIIMNLCTNASHAMREKGGTLDIRLVQERVEQARTLNSFDLTAGNYAKLTVSDTGCGIDPSIMNRIFDPFYTTKPPGEGTGLGLSVVYGIVRNHDGAVDVTSEPGKGTTVSVYLPLVETGELISERISERIPGGSERILFVDDEPALVELGSMMLTSFGYHVTSRTSSSEALEAFRAAPHDFDLVITDMTMPNMRGDGLAGELLKIRPDISIILCTGFSEMISEEKAKSLGIRQFIMKPIFKKDLAKAVRDVLDRS